MLTPARFALILAEGLVVGSLWFVLGYVVGDHRPSVTVGLTGVIWGMAMSMLRVTDLRRSRRRRKVPDA